MGDWTEVCRHALLVGSGLWLQSGILLSAGLGAGWIMRANEGQRVIAITSELNSPMR